MGIIKDRFKAKADKVAVEIKDLLKEKAHKRNFLNNMGNTPN